jgi:antitoxin ParD1/3/4
MANVSIELPDGMKSFVEAQVSTGGYASVSDYFAALVAVAQSQQARAEIDAQLLAGIDSLERGEGREFTEQDWKRLRDQAGRKP